MMSPKDVPAYPRSRRSSSVAHTIFCRVSLTMTTIIDYDGHHRRFTMQQLVLNAPGRAVWSEVAEPVLTGDTDALVRPLAVATCDLDTAINAGAIPLPLPYELGHE